MHPSKPDPLTSLREQLDEARETIRQLQAVISPEVPSVFEGLSLSRSEVKVLDMLLTAKGLCSRDQIYAKLYLMRTKIDVDAPDPNIIAVFICHLRQKLTPLDVKIGTVWGQGYMLPDAGKARLNAIRRTSMSESIAENTGSSFC